MSEQNQERQERQEQSQEGMTNDVAAFQVLLHVGAEGTDEAGIIKGMSLQWNQDVVRTAQMAAMVLTEVKRQLDDVGITTSLVLRSGWEASQSVGDGTSESEEGEAE